MNKSHQPHPKSQTPKRPPNNGNLVVNPVKGLIKEILIPQPSDEVLRKSDLDFKLLLNNIPAVVFKGYMDGSVDFFDQKVEKLTGYPRTDFESRERKWTELILAEDIPQVKQVFIQALRSNRAYVREYRIRNRKGKILWIQERSQIVCDHSG